jgi:hypothetical protein
LHNFIRRYDPFELSDFAGKSDDNFLDEVDFNIYGTLANALPSHSDRQTAEEWRDEIAGTMWEDYNAYLRAQV